MGDRQAPWARAAISWPCGPGIPGPSCLSFLYSGQDLESWKEVPQGPIPGSPEKVQKQAQSHLGNRTWDMAVSPPPEDCSLSSQHGLAVGYLAFQLPAPRQGALCWLLRGL